MEGARGRAGSGSCGDERQRELGGGRTRWRKDLAAGVGFAKRPGAVGGNPRVLPSGLDVLAGPLTGPGIGLVGWEVLLPFFIKGFAYYFPV
jgi:hypothetical protein